MVLVAVLACGLAHGADPTDPTDQSDRSDYAPSKTQSVFYSQDLLAHATANAAQHDWAKAMQDQLIAAAAPWKALSNDELWDAMFGPNIPRTWMVWSDGYCPGCTEPVRMYTWEVDPFAFPWKVRCPHCKELFPKNDFEAFHESGYDAHGVFQPDLADRSLLFNTEHPDPGDPLHLFGVDDGTGYQADGHTWRFIGWYVIFGQWKKWVHAGIVNLSAAYAATGDPEYALKAAIMLDRVGDVYHTFDFHNQGGLVYETTQGTRGQISTWHDACEEVRHLALAYDRVFDGAKLQDAALTAYLSEKATAYQLDNPKTSWNDIQRNIETGIFVSTLEHRERIASNYPRTDIAMLVIKTVLGWPGNRDAVLGLVDGIVEKATAVDGVSGEKGMAGYTTIAPHALAEILSQMRRLEPGLLETVFERHPPLRNTYRFHLDMWCMESWYPRSGDTGVIGKKNETYVGVPFSKNPGVEPSMYAFLMDVAELTDDPGLVEVLYLANGSTVEGLPFDLFADDPAAFQKNVQDVIDEHGQTPNLSSVNKQQWNLAILRSGEGEHRRALWLDYDSHERHSHRDGMNIGLFAKGLDLIPDFGYPPVGYGGWGAPRAVWYTMTPAHVTVAVDGKNQAAASGETTLWAEGDRFHAIRASSPGMVEGEQFERLIALVDVDEENFYAMDVFRVKGGSSHTNFFHSSFGQVATSGLQLSDSPPYSDDVQMRSFRRDEDPERGWSVDWTIEDPYDYVSPDREIHLRYTDLTSDAAASLAESWVDIGLFGAESRWIPSLFVQREGAAPLASTFVSVIEPYEGQRGFESMERLDSPQSDLPEDGYVGVVLNRTDGGREVFLYGLNGAQSELTHSDAGVNAVGELVYLSFTATGLARAAVWNCQSLRIGEWKLEFAPDTGYMEIDFVDGQARVVVGQADSLVATTNG
jgi:hypothetical protein